MTTLQHNRRQVASFYDADASTYDEVRWLTSAGARNNGAQLRILEALLQPAPGLGVDLGSGTGRFSGCLARRVPSIALVDAAPGMLRMASARVPSARPVLGDITQLPMADGSAAAVVCLNVLSHVPEWQRAISEIARILEPGGQAVINFNNSASLYFLPAWIVNRRRRSFRANVFSRWVNWSAFSAALESAGLRIQDTRGHLPIPTWLPRPAVALAAALDRILVRRPRLAPLPFLRLVKSGTARAGA